MTVSRIRVLSAGITTIQDGGREGYADLGIPTSGAWDRHAYSRITGLLSIHTGPVLECLAGDLALEADKDIVWAWTGPARAELNGSPIPAETLIAGQGRIVLERTGTGPIYFATAGLHISPVLNSASTDTHSGLGPAPLKAGDTLNTPENNRKDQAQVGAFVMTPSAPRDKSTLRLVPHSPELARWLTFHHWKVVSVARSGIRCQRINPQPTADLPAVPRDLKSYPTLPGLIQMPSADEIIILGPDCGTSGGYATAGTIITADAAAPAYVSMGEALQFATTTPAKAVSAHEARSAATTIRSINAISAGTSSVG